MREAAATVVGAGKGREVEVGRRVAEAMVAVVQWEADRVREESPERRLSLVSLAVVVPAVVGSVAMGTLVGQAGVVKEAAGA